MMQDGSELAQLRKLVGLNLKLVYEAVKAGKVADLSRENQLYAQVIQEHLHLAYIHNALEFADVREGAPYEIEFEGQAVSPLAHLTMHAAVKAQVEKAPYVRAAFEKLVATGVASHHAEHILGCLFLQAYWEANQAPNTGGAPDKSQVKYRQSLRKIYQDPAFRKKLARKFTLEHPAFELEERMSRT
jgi:uncharacterized protein DUF1841